MVANSANPITKTTFDANIVPTKGSRRKGIREEDKPDITTDKKRIKTNLKISDPLQTTPLTTLYDARGSPLEQMSSSPEYHQGNRCRQQLQKTP